MDMRKEWSMARDELMYAMKQMGFHEELGGLIAKQLGSPKAIRKMTAYLYNARPDSEEIVVDEMLAICSEIETWRDKKAAREANEAYNEMLYHWIDDEEE